MVPMNFDYLYRENIESAHIHPYEVHLNNQKAIIDDSTQSF